MPYDVDLLKLDVPKNATRETPWMVTRQSRFRYYLPVITPRESLSDYGPLRYKSSYDPDELEKDSDTFVVLAARQVSVTPISLDKTSRTDFNALRDILSG